MRAAQLLLMIHMPAWLEQGHTMGKAPFFNTAAVVLALAGLAAPPLARAAAARAQAAQPSAAMAHPSRALWLDMKGTPPATSARGTPSAVQAKTLRALSLDRSSIAAMVATAPMERTDAARSNPVVLSLPDPWHFP